MLYSDYKPAPLLPRADYFPLQVFFFVLNGCWGRKRKCRLLDEASE